MKRILAAAGLLVLLGLAGYGASLAFGAGETTGTQTFTNVVTYTIPTVTQTVTVTVGGTTTAPATTTQPTTTAPPPPPPNNCTSTLAAGGNVVSFVNGLSPGAVGCLRGGTYGQDPNAVGAWNHFTVSGTSSAPVTIQSYPGETAIIRGYTAIGGNYNVFTHLKVDIANSGSGGSGCAVHAVGVEVDGANDVFDHLEVTSSLAGYSRSAFLVLGNNTTIRYSKVHDYGACDAHDHGVYDQSGSGAQIHHNWFWNGPFGWGVQVYPSASGGHIYANVIDGSGSGFVVCTGGSSNILENNVVSNSLGTSQVPGSLVDGCGSSGSGNVVRNSDQWNNPGGFGGASGVSMSGNVSVDPQYANPAAHDYRVLAPSLAGYGLWDGS